jgi:dihydroorotase
MGFDLVLRGGNVVTSTRSEVADVGIRGGKIAEIGDLAGTPAQQIVDVRGLTVMSGVIDTQVHFREPGLEHKEDLATGTLAALTGGVTSILEMPNTHPTTTNAEALADKLQRANGRAWCHYGFFVGATTENIDRLAEYETLPGTPGIKIFMGSSTGPLLVGEDEYLREVLRNGRKRCPIHAEDEPRNVRRKALVSESPHPREHPFLRDAESARLATERILRISEETGRPVHILHVSTLEEPPLIADAKRRGLGTTAEVTPQHLWFAAPECYEQLGALAQMNPPIRSAEHREALWRALAEGVFDVFGSDHAPHTLEEKAKPYPQSPSGMPGVQTLLPVLLTFVAQGRLSLSTVVRMACERPAEIYGIRGKGRLEAGFDADITVVDPNKSYVFERSMVRSKCGWSPYEEARLTGSVEHVVLGGRLAMSGGEPEGTANGRMLEFE